VSELDALNAAVTAAILKAQGLDRDSARAWHIVADIEKQLAEHAETPPFERDIAERGVVTARARCELLRQGSRVFEDKLDDLALKVTLLFRPDLEQETTEFLKTAERVRLLIGQVLRS
jgi:hypothetical protein